MKNQSKSRKLWKQATEDPNIIYFGISLISGVGAFLAALVLFLMGSGPWWQVFLTFIMLSTYIWAFSVFFRQIRNLTNQLETKHLPVCFVVGKTADKAQQGFDELKSAVIELTGFSAFNKIEGFSSRAHCLMPQERNRLPTEMPRWKEYISEAIRGVQGFADALPGKKVYHIAVNGPASLAIGLGAVFGTKHPLVCYHFQDDSYIPVLDLRQDVRRVKEHLPAEHQYRYYKVTYPQTYTPDVAVVIGGASHEAAARVRQYLKAQGTEMSIVVVDDMYGGNLTEKDWLVPVQELFSVFNNISKIEAASRIHLFYAMQVAMGFGLGMALRPLAVTLYNYEETQATYYPVLKLNELGISC